MDTQYGLEDILTFIKRRKKMLLACFFSIFITAIIVALALPPVYKAEVRILRESQQISEDYVRSTITSYAEERFNAITQKVITYPTLMAIIDQYNLYTDQRELKPIGALVEKMRDAINVSSIYENVMNDQTGRPISMSAAFLLSFEGRDPTTVQKVANQLASLYIEEDAKTREKSASATAKFFEEELQGLTTEIRKLENKISQFKEKHIGELPETYGMNLRVIDRLERELDRIEGRLRSLEERRMFLKAQIITVDPLLPIRTETGTTMASPSERLKQLHLRLMSLQSKLSDKHPDVISLKAEIRDLENQVTQSENTSGKIKYLEMLLGQQAQLKSKLGERHPDVIALEKEIEQVSGEIDNLNVESIKHRVAEEQPDNPTYIHLQTQIFSIESEIKNIHKDKLKASQLLDDYQKRIEGSPQIEKEYKELTRDYESTKKKYNDISNKLMEARVSQGMEETQRGEHFIVSEIARLPGKPYKPNRLAIILLGIIMGLAVGLGVAALQESMDNTIKSVEDLSMVGGIDVFATVTYIKTDAERRKEKLKKVAWGASLSGAVVCGLVLVDRLIIPLDNLWAEIINRLVGT